MYKAHMAKSDRFKVGTDPKFTTVGAFAGTDQRPAALEPPALTPPLATWDGGAPLAIAALDRMVAEQMKPTAAKFSKYRNKPTDGYVSIRESKRAFQLKLMQEAGQIRNLREQVSFLLIPKQEGERACSYVADFCYEEFSRVERDDNGEMDIWRTVVEDCKGMRTDVYRIKRKLMLFVHKIRIRET
jgi:hypothetical protein